MCSCEHLPMPSLLRVPTDKFIIISACFTICHKLCHLVTHKNTAIFCCSILIVCLE